MTETAQEHYHGSPDQIRLDRLYSFSDRIRYFWPNREVQAALETLHANLGQCSVPRTLLSQYFPVPFESLRSGELGSDAGSLFSAKISEVLHKFSSACAPGASLIKI